MRSPLRSVATLLLAVAAITCTTDAPSGPGQGGLAGPHARLAFAPNFTKAAAAVYDNLDQYGLNFDSVRVVIRGFPDTTQIVKDTTVFFTPGTDSLVLNLTVPVEGANQPFNLNLAYQNNGTTVFSGTAVVHAHLPGQPAATTDTVTVNYTGPGSQVAKITVAPKTVSLSPTQTQTFTVTAVDAAGNTLTNVPIQWQLSDSTIGTIGQNTGLFTPSGKRGTVTVTATTPTLLSDNATATINLPPTAIVVVSGSGQTGKAGTTLASPGVVQVNAADGLGVAGVTVVFAPPAGGAVGSPTAVTDANGRASTSLKLGTTIGTQGFAASAAGFQVGISETATASDPATLTLVSGSAQSDTTHATLAQPLVVKVADQFGNVASGVTVAWARTAGSGAVSAATSVTDASGNAKISYTLGATPGTDTIAATVAGVTAPVVFTAITNAASASKLVFTVQPSATTAGVAISPAIQVALRDADGNPTTSTASVTLAIGNNPSTATLSGTLTEKAASGVASFSGVKLDKAGTGYTLLASATGVNSSTSTPFSVISAPATQLVLSTGTQTSFTATAGAAIPNPPSLKALDASNNGVPNVPIEIVVTEPIAGQPFVLKDTTINADSTGVLSFGALPPVTLVGTYTLTATSPAIASAKVTVTLTVSAAAASKYVILGLPAGVASTPAGTEIFLDAERTDAFGNAVSTPTQQTLTWTTTGGSFVQPTQPFNVTTLFANLAHSLEQFITQSTAGTQHITVTDGAALTGAIDIVSGTPDAHVGKTNPPPAVSGSPGASLGGPIVTVTNASGNPLSGVLVTFQANAGKNVLLLNSTSSLSNSVIVSTNSSGVASILDWKLGTTGGANSDTVLVTVPGATESPLRFVASVVSGSTASIAFSGAPTSAVAFDTLSSITVTEKDANGNTATSSGSVSLALSGTSCAATLLKGTTAQSFVSGVAVFNDLSIAGVATGCVLTATVSTFTAQTPAFNVAAQVPFGLAVVLPANASHTAKNGIGFTAPIKVRVVDAKATTVADPGVVITSSAVGASRAAIATTNGSATTDATGVANFSTMFVTGLAQTFEMQFLATGLNSALSPGTDTLVAGNPTLMVAQTPTTIIQAVGSSTSTTTVPQIKITDASGNPVSGVLPTWSRSSPCNPNFSNGTWGTSDANGLATGPTLTFPALTPISCDISVQVAPSAQNISGSPMLFTVVIAPPNANVWLGTTSDSWEVGTNWSKAAAPTTTDVVMVPGTTVGIASDGKGDRYPTMSVNHTIGSLYAEVNSSATVTIGTDTLTVGGSVVGDPIRPTINSSGNGLLRLASTVAAPNDTVQGDFTRMIVGSSSNCPAAPSLSTTAYSIGAGFRATDTVFVYCPLVVGKGAIDMSSFAAANLRIVGSGGLLDMSAAGTVSVGNVLFAGASEVGHLTAGTLNIAGDFTQLSTYSKTSFAATAGHLTVFTGSPSTHVSNISFAASTFVGTSPRTLAAQRQGLLTTLRGSPGLQASAVLRSQLASTRPITRSARIGGIGRASIDAATYIDTAQASFGSLRISTGNSGVAKAAGLTLFVAGDLTLDANTSLVGVGEDSLALSALIAGGLTQGANSLLGMVGVAMVGTSVPVIPSSATTAEAFGLFGSGMATMAADANFPSQLLVIGQPINVGSHALTTSGLTYVVDSSEVATFSQLISLSDLAGALASNSGQLNMTSTSAVTVGSSSNSDSGILFESNVPSSINGGTLTVAGNVLEVAEGEQVTAPTSFSAPNTTVILSSSSPQFVSLFRSDLTQFYDLQINNTSGVDITTNAAAVHQVDLKSNAILTMGTSFENSAPVVTTLTLSGLTAVVNFHGGSAFNGNLSLANNASCFQHDGTLSLAAPVFTPPLTVNCTAKPLP